MSKKFMAVAVKLIVLASVGYFLAVNYFGLVYYNIVFNQDEVKATKKIAVMEREKRQTQVKPEAKPVTATPTPIKKPAVELAVTYSDRKDYKDGDLILRIDRLGVKKKVMNGTGVKNLKKGPCLYEIADLPGEGDKNVVIAGHRDTYTANFYNIDKIKEKDKIILYFNGNEYIYTYLATEITKKNDWSLTEKKGESIVTLTSCHPKRSNAQRIAVVARLTEIRATP